MIPALTADVPPAVVWGWLAQSLAVPRLQQQPLPLPLLFLDVETTRDRVVELAMVRFAPGYPPWVFHTYVQPGTVGWQRGAGYWNTHVHGVTSAMVQGRPTFAQVAPTLLQALGGATVVAHNVAFERRFVGQELRRVGADFHAPTLCTLRLARDLLPERHEHTLDGLAAAHHVRNPAPHRALGDTLSCLWVLLGMLEGYRGKRPLAEVVRGCLRTADNQRLNPWVD